jgi:hypothetical protein
VTRVESVARHSLCAIGNFDEMSLDKGVESFECIIQRTQNIILGESITLVA